MSGMERSIHFSVVVESPEKWTDEHRVAADKEDVLGTYDDWVIDLLKVRMAKAGQDFIAENPDLFKYTELI